MTTTKDDLRFDQVSIGQSFELSVVSGEIPQLTAHRIHARNPDIGTSVEDIWTVGGVMSWPTSAAVLNMWSSSANDANTTTAIGTRTVRIEGLLAGFTATTEDVNLNGTATVTSSNSFIRINKAYSLISGTYGGTIDPIHGTVTFSLGGTATCNLYLDDSITCGETQVGRYTVPAGYTAYISKLDISVASGKSANIYMFKRENADDVVSPYTSKRLIGVYDGLTGYNPVTSEWTGFSSKTDIWFSAKAAAVNTSVALEIHLVLKEIA